MAKEARKSFRYRFRPCVETLEDRRMLSVNVQLASRGLDGSAAGAYDPHYDSAASVAVSADGRYVAFSSRAANLVSGVSLTPNIDNVYRYDRLSGALQLVSINTQGTGGANGFCGEVVISADGNVVTYLSTATNLHPLDTDMFSDVFARNFTTGTTQLVSVNRFGTGGGGATSRAPAISADGTVIAFRSYSEKLHLLDQDTNWDIFARNLVTGTTQLVTVNYAGTGTGNDIGAASSPVISADGNVVAFTSVASNLHPLDNNGETDVFARNLAEGQTYLVSMKSDGSGSGDEYSSGTPALSADGQIIAFSSHASLVPSDHDVGPGDATGDVYVRDLTTGLIQLVSINQSATDSGNRQSGSPSISADGHMVAFASSADDLVGLKLEARNVFVRNLTAGTTQLASVSPSGASGNDGNYDPTISADGRVVVFHSTSSNLHPADTEFDEDDVDIYARDLTTGKTALVSINPTGTSAGNGESIDPVVSADGSVVAFSSRASNLAGPDVNGISDAFVATISFNAPELLGDYNRDGMVNTADYVMWRKTMGTAIDYFAGADGSGNGIVGPEDYSVWRAHFGERLAEVVSAPVTSELVRTAVVVEEEEINAKPQAAGVLVALADCVMRVDRGRPLSVRKEVVGEGRREQLLSAVTLVRVRDGGAELPRTQGEAGGEDVETVDCAFTEFSGWELKATRRGSLSSVLR